MPVKCKHCGTILPNDTNKKLVYCSRGRVAVGGCKHYNRILGDCKDWEKSPSNE